MKVSAYLLYPLIFVSAFVIYNINFRVITSHDNMPTRLLGLSILEEKNLYLDSYFPELLQNVSGEKPDWAWTLRIKEPHVVAEKTTWVGLFVSPLFNFFYRILPGNPRQIYEDPNFSFKLHQAEKLTASTIASISVVIFYLVAQYFFPLNLSLLITFIYAFTTSHWTISSQGLWTHGAVEFWLLCSLFLLLTYKKQKKSFYLYAAGFSAGTIYLMRPIGLIYALFFSYIVIKQFRKDWVKFLLPLSIILTVHLTFTYLTYGSVFAGYSSFLGRRFFWEFGLREVILAFLGIFISPGRGLFFYSPILILSFIGIFFLPKREEFKLFSNLIPAVFLIIFIFATYVDTSPFIKWSGGWTWGPRYFTDVLPVLAILLGVVLEKLLDLSRSTRKHLLLTIIFVFGIWSIFTQVVGAFYYSNAWNRGIIDPSSDGKPTAILFEREKGIRVWDLKNNPIIVELRTRNKTPFDPDTQSILKNSLAR